MPHDNLCVTFDWPEEEYKNMSQNIIVEENIFKIFQDQPMFETEKSYLRKNAKY